MKEAAAVTLWDRLRADHGRIFMWVLVWLFTMSSVVVNGAHALDAMGDGATAWMRAFAVAVAGFFPFAGLVMTEAVLIMIRSWRTGRWWVTAMQGLLVTASGVMLIVAFWRSFNALTEMAVRLAMPASDAWMLPVLTDTGIVVGTLGVVLAEVKMKLDELPSSWPDEVAVGAPVGVAATSGDEVGGEAAAAGRPAGGHLDTAGPVPVTSVRGQAVNDGFSPDTVGVRPVDTVVGTDPETASRPSVQVSTGVLDTDPDTAPVPSVQAVDLGVDTLTDLAMSSMTTPADTGVTADTGVPDTTDGGVRDTEMSVTADTSPVMDTGVKAAVMDTGDGTGLDLSAVTVAVIAEVGTSAEPAIVERALRLGLDGLSARRISEAMAPDGPSRTPVAAWLKAAKQRSDYATAIGLGADRPALTAVR